MKKVIILVLTVSSLFAWGYESYAKQTLQSRLRDVDSAKFRNLTMKQKNTVCGQVNAKNGFGAYTGWKDFIGGGTVAFFSSDMATYNDWVNAWNEVCR